MINEPLISVPCHKYSVNGHLRGFLAIDIPVSPMLHSGDQPVRSHLCAYLFLDGA